MRAELRSAAAVAGHALRRELVLAEVLRAARRVAHHAHGRVVAKEDRRVARVVIAVALAVVLARREAVGVALAVSFTIIRARLAALAITDRSPVRRVARVAARLVLQQRTVERRPPWGRLPALFKKGGRRLRMGHFRRQGPRLTAVRPREPCC
jgi:hypothetical protein